MPISFNIFFEALLLVSLLIYGTSCRSNHNEANLLFDKTFRWTNSLGMVFVSIPGTDVDFCIWETRQRDWRVFSERGPRETNDFFPIQVTSEEAESFCAWLTHEEMAKGLLKSNVSYRLPTDLEWSIAVGIAGSNADASKWVYPWGDYFPPNEADGNYLDKTSDLTKTGKSGGKHSQV